MSKPYTFGDSAYLHAEPSGEQSRYENEDDDGAWSTMDDFNNRPGRASRQSLAYGPDNGYSYNVKSSSMLLDETVAPVELSKTDWARGEPKAEMNAKRVLRRSEIGERRKAAGNWMKQGQRWRYLVFFVFGFLIALGLTLYFVIPRAPLFEFTSTQPLTSTDTSPQVSTIPPTFSFAANLTLAVDARASYVPIHFSTLSLSISDLDTEAVVATGSSNGLSVPGQAITSITVPIFFKPAQGYANSTDPTYGAIRSACGPIYATIDRPTLSLALVVTMSVQGLIGTTHTATQVSGIVCPVAFSASAP